MALFVLTLNMRVFLWLRAQHKQTTTLDTPKHVHVKQQRERKLFAQFFISVVMFVLFDIMFIALPKISDRYERRFVVRR